MGVRKSCSKKSVGVLPGRIEEKVWRNKPQWLKCFVHVVSPWFWLGGALVIIYCLLVVTSLGQLNS